MTKPKPLGKYPEFARAFEEAARWPLTSVRVARGLSESGAINLMRRLTIAKAGVKLYPPEDYPLVYQAVWAKRLGFYKDEEWPGSYMVFVVVQPPGEREEILDRVQQFLDAKK